jgi:hypothetical protein
MGAQPIIFVSYAHTDTKWLKELDPHLRGLERYAKVERVDDRKLLGGDAWDAEVKASLERADIILLIVTANFIGSDYIHRVELPAALRRRQDDGSIVIPVLFQDCARRLLAIDDINYLPKDPNGNLKPLARWRGAERDTGFAQVVEHVDAQIKRLRARAEREVEAAGISGIDLALYRRRAQQKWSAVDLYALAAPGAVDADVTIHLADVFVPQLARRSRPAVSLPRDYLEKQGLDPLAEAAQIEQIASAWERLTPVSAVELAAECRQRHLVLLGDPGAGKSALARYVLLQLLNDTAPANSPFAALADHVPFLVELRDFVLREAEGRCADLLSYLAYCGRELGFGFEARSLEQQFTERPSLLIIDGLDEIFDRRRRRLMVDQIIGLALRYSKLRLFITSRIAGFVDNPFRAAEFSVATLIDLTPQQVEGFAKAWFAIVFPADPDAAARARDDLLETLRRRPQLRAIAGNPMILTIMATVARHRRIGRSRAALYTQALELLCYNWDYRRGLGLPPDSPLIDLQADDTLLMLRRIAWRMQEVPDGLRANAISEAALRGVIEDFFGYYWRFDTPKAGRAASEMLQRLEERNWVLTLRGPGLYGFVHRTFLEYLCALELSEGFKAQQLDIDTLIRNHVVSRLDDDTWHEVLRLLIGSMPPPAAEQMLLALLPSKPETTADTARLVLTWQGLAEIEPRAIPGLAQICSELTDSLYHWLAVNNEKYSDMNTIIRAIMEAATTIGRIAWPAPHPPNREWPLPRDNSRHVVPALIGALGKSVWDCPDATYQHLKILCEDKDHMTRTDAVLNLAGQFPDKVDTFRLVRAHATEDPEWFCRQWALKALGDNFRQNSETKILLRSRAIEDGASGCRKAALQVLAAVFSEDPETRMLLRSRAIEDADRDCRGAALGALAQHFREDHETRMLLRSRAIEDADRDCRGAALEALAQHFREDPETKILLRSRAIEDAEGRCRGLALSLLAQVLDVPGLPVLASQDLDGLHPGRDPRRPITSGDITRGARQLKESEETIRALFRRLAEEVPLRFTRGALKAGKAGPLKPRNSASSALATAERPAVTPPRSVGAFAPAPPHRRGARGAG